MTVFARSSACAATFPERREPAGPDSNSYLIVFWTV
jgi:hypothetical protein